MSHRCFFKIPPVTFVNSSRLNSTPLVIYCFNEKFSRNRWFSTKKLEDFMLIMLCSWNLKSFNCEKKEKKWKKADKAICVRHEKKIIQKSTFHVIFALIVDFNFKLRQVLVAIVSFSPTPEIIVKPSFSCHNNEKRASVDLTCWDSPRFFDLTKLSR